jgi:hydrogenase-1 operon protein HyaF
MMKAFPIPVRAVEGAIGPGSQPVEDAPLDVLPMPGLMQTFEMPRVPDRVAPAVMLESAAVLRAMLDALRGNGTSPGAAGMARNPTVTLDGVSPAALEVTNQVLGEGEVSVRVAALPDQPELHVQESVFAGLWRCCELDAEGRLARYWLEAGAAPAAVLRAAQTAIANQGVIADPEAWPEGTMNAPALLAELRARVATHRSGGRGGQLNLSLLPLSPADHRVLATALPVGSVAIISRGFGNCHVGSTHVPGVWRQQYFNSMNTLILDLVEVTEIPEVATASAEDLEDSRERLAELVGWMRETAVMEEAHDQAGH